MFFFSTIQKSLQVLQRDKFIVLLALFPVAIGMLLYFHLGSWLFYSALPAGKTWLAAHLASDNLTIFLSYLLAIIVTVFMFFVINWTFLLVVTLLASPFNDWISSRVAQVLGENNQENPSWNPLKILIILWNETKKIILILILTILAIVISYIPLFLPISIFISGLLLATSFLDYSWSRNNYPASTCFKNMLTGWFVYGISGIVFLFFVSIPIVNLLALPFAVVYFTVLFIERKKTINQNNSN